MVLVWWFPLRGLLVQPSRGPCVVPTSVCVLVCAVTSNQARPTEKISTVKIVPLTVQRAPPLSLPMQIEIRANVVDVHTGAPAFRSIAGARGLHMSVLCGGAIIRGPTPLGVDFVALQPPRVDLTDLGFFLCTDLTSTST